MARRPAEDLLVAGGARVAHVPPPTPADKAFLKVALEHAERAERPVLRAA